MSNYKFKYTKEDYNNKNGMRKNIWGPILWAYLHLISFNYPLEPTNIDKMKYMRLLITIGETLPCSVCRNHFRENLNSMNFSIEHLKNRETFSMFIYKLHDKVNQSNNKKSPNYFLVRDNYERFRYRDNNDINNSEKNFKCKLLLSED